MHAKDLGQKHTCWKCGAKFYDLKKSEPACPKCGTDPRDAPVVKSPPAERRRPAREEPVQEAEVDEGKPDEDLEEVDEEAEEGDDDE